jgi:hypothetical protein
MAGNFWRLVQVKEMRMAEGENGTFSPVEFEAREAEMLKREQERLRASIRSSAGWFFWIAGASIVNTLLMIFAVNLMFVVGLAIPLLASALAQDSSMAMNVIAFVVTVIMAGLFVFFGIYARRRHVWAFILGIILYAIDGILFVLIRDWMSIVFHVLALVYLSMGVQSVLKSKRLEKEAAALPAPAVNTGAVR